MGKKFKQKKLKKKKFGNKKKLENNSKKTLKKNSPAKIIFPKQSSSDTTWCPASQ